MPAEGRPRQTSGITMALIVRYVRSNGGDVALTKVLERAGEKRSLEELLDEKRWSSYDEKVALLEAAAEVLDDPLVPRKIGQEAISMGVGAGVKLAIRALGSTERIFRSLPRVTPKFSTVTEMTAVEVGSSNAVIESRTEGSCVPARVDCEYTVGLLSSIPLLFGLPPGKVAHVTCQAEGADRCLFHVRWQTRRKHGLSARRSRIKDLEGQVKTLQESTEALRSTTVDLVSPDDLSHVLSKIANRAFATVGAAAYLLSVRTAPGMIEVLHEGIDDELAQRLSDAFQSDRVFDPGFPMMVAEVASERRTYGVICAMYPEGGDFLDADAEVLEVYARNAAVALDVATALDEAQMQNKTASALLDVARSLADASGTDEVCERLVSAVKVVFGVERAVIMTWDPERELLVPRAATGFPPELEAQMLQMEISQSDAPGLLDVWSSDQPLLAELDSTDDPWVRSQMETFGSIASYNVPVKVNGQPVALLSVVAGREGFSLARGVLEERLRGLADQAARAFENAAVLERQKARSERIRGQKEILEMVARGEDLRQILDALCFTVEGQIEGGRASLMLMDRDGQTLQTVSAPNLPGEFTWAINGIKPGLFAGSMGTAVYREHAVYAECIATDRLWEGRRTEAETNDIRAAWSVPVFSANDVKVLGVLTVFLDREGQPGEHERAYMEMAVQLASIAIEKRELEERLTHQAFHDSLTGLPNRALFADRVQHALDRGLRQGEAIAVLLIDLDNFKSVNDSLGHLAGDELLRVVSDRLRQCLRSADTAARLGGDEFAILLEATNRRSARNIADRILESLAEPLLLFGAEIRSPGSIGIAFCEDGKGTVSDLLRNADTAMYAAKDAGRGRYEVFEQRMQFGILARLELQADLQRAVDADEFVVHYQPVYRLDPHELVGVEALVRWRHPTRGLLSPFDFISMAEDTGLIVPIGKKVLESACAQMAEWRASIGNPLKVGVNFSARQLQTPTLVRDIRNCIEAYSLEPELLMVEITESVLMQDPEEIAAKLKQLRDIGVGIAIDDFGTGYSSLSYLRRFPVSYLKVDKYFVQGMDRGAEEAAYGRAIVRLGHGLDLSVIAEGIETPGEYEALLEMGCDLGQGYLFAKPMPAAEILTVPGIRAATS